MLMQEPLSVKRSLASTLTIGSSGTLGGTGTVQDVVNNGSVAPGNSIGTINIAGNYTQYQGRCYQSMVGK